jgi:WhiB family transcriptional regulator, redox-sensing transcriptional regulator
VLQNTQQYLDALAAGGKRALTLVDAVPYTGSTADTLIDDNWWDRAACLGVDDEAFFPERGGSTYEAKKLCRICPVKGECLEYALENDESWGVWGGMSERERRKLKREQVAA